MIGLKTLDLVDRNTFPSLGSFLQYSDSEIVHFTDLYNIKTCYLPVDGTRRFFLLYNSSINEWDEKNFNEYFKEVNKKFREVFSLIYDFGIKNLLLLLMDKSVFMRGRAYLQNAIEKGIYPLFEDQNYLNLYETYDIDVKFAGFTSILESYYGKDELAKLENNFFLLNKDERERKFIIYNGLSPIEDYLLVEQYANELRKENISVTKNNLIKKIYRTNLEPIDFSIWYGYPRDKIVPPLLWEDGPKFFIKNPTLTLNPIQLKKVIYYSALSKQSIKDSYYTHKFTEKEKADYQNDILNEDSIFGSDYYYND